MPVFFILFVINCYLNGLPIKTACNMLLRCISACTRAIYLPAQKKWANVKPFYR